MDKTPLTDEQKEWFFYGYFLATSRQLAEELKINEEEAKIILIDGLKK